MGYFDSHPDDDVRHFHSRLNDFLNRTQRFAAQPASSPATSHSSDACVRYIDFDDTDNAGIQYRLDPAQILLNGVNMRDGSRQAALPRRSDLDLLKARLTPPTEAPPDTEALDCIEAPTNGQRRILGGRRKQLRCRQKRKSVIQAGSLLEALCFIGQQRKAPLR